MKDRIFTDPSFPPVPSSIFGDTDPIDFGREIVWKRPHEFLSGQIKMFLGDIEDSDIIQG